MGKVIDLDDIPAEEFWCRDALLEALMNAPAIEPERKNGKWKMISPAGLYECSKCGQNVLTKDIDCYKFCHGCGAKMNGGNTNAHNT